MLTTGPPANFSCTFFDLVKVKSFLSKNLQTYPDDSDDVHPCSGYAWCMKGCDVSMRLLPRVFLELRHEDDHPSSRIGFPHRSETPEDDEHERPPITWHNLCNHGHCWWYSNPTSYAMQDSQGHHGGISRGHGHEKTQQADPQVAQNNGKSSTLQICQETRHWMPHGQACEGTGILKYQQETVERRCFKDAMTSTMTSMTSMERWKMWKTQRQVLIRFYKLVATRAMIETSSPLQPLLQSSLQAARLPGG